ncbi:hypothetical protein NSK_000459 [Nannochloropsis salina CCMP1776]|jgi:UDP-glucuronate 4-epimerase|uniref:NAD(P)-binding domain-containing protein n=1 Tax=Nannochloropsis salina CCMP1776 TaxID=1027361 RepID=A0A4D9DEP6_9STRA|nr:hypothetical protein NSK_000459 [Nannochloropsis salina CCMP1776]|eukprot:TFJ88105.1 hypothetical protein NSK_000459 [Nannochloropsis salina CCMP1776]
MTGEYVHQRQEHDSSSDVDTALLVPDVTSITMPLRAESLRKLEAVGSCHGLASTQQASGASDACEGGDRRSSPAFSAATSRADKTDNVGEENDDQSRTSGSDLVPTTTDDSDEEDTSSLATDETPDHMQRHADSFLSVDRGSLLAPPVEGGKKVLVTGGAGFVGSHVADHLLSRGDAVVVVDEFNDYYDTSLKRANVAHLLAKHGSARLRVVEADICDAHAMEQLFITERPRHVVHMAARAGVRPSIDDPFIYIHSNMLGTTRLLELARIHGNDCFVWASSSSVYGGSSLEEFGEDDYVDNPVSPYAATKKACELMTHTYHSLYKMNVTGLRFFTVYGPRGRPDMAPFKFVDRVSRGLEIQQFGDGSSSRDYTYIDDIVDGVVRALDRPLGYQIFNLGNGSPYRLSDFIRLVEKNVGKAAVIKVLPDQPGDVPRTCANISKAQELLGYQPKVSFEEGIARTVEWYTGWRAEKSMEAEKEEEKTGEGKGVEKAGKSTKGVQPGNMARVASAASVFSQGGLSG